MEGRRELFGPECCRHELWGHSIMSQLGLTLLPSLSNTDIFAEGEELFALEKEIRFVVANLPRIAEATHYAEEFVSARCQNALNAIGLARELGGGVTIG